MFSNEDVPDKHLVQSEYLFLQVRTVSSGKGCSSKELEREMSGGTKYIRYDT